jgi:hypothetical protein
MKPILLDYIVKRTASNTSIPYKYDASQSMNVVPINGENKLLIELEACDIETTTKTKVHREGDDQNFMLELGTVTKIPRESDNTYDLLEVKTKTFTARESDDQHNAHYEQF